MASADGMRGIYLTILLRPVDNDWIMGEDVPVSFHFEMTIIGLKK